MNDRLHIHKKASSQSDSTPLSSQFQTRIASPPKASPQQQMPTIQAQRERARKGINLLEIPSVFAPRETSAQPAIQRKLTIGQPGDKYEQEADRVAAQVVSQINAPASAMMKPETEHVGSGLVQCKPSNASISATPDLEESIQQARGGGQPLEATIKAPMEQAFGANFGGVKVHTDARSDQLNQSIQAKAFTTGQDIFFRQGEYNPTSRGGQELLAHELTHVVQQNGTQIQQKSQHTQSKEVIQAAGQDTVKNQETQQKFTVDTQKIAQFQKQKPDHAHLVAGFDGQMDERKVLAKLIDNFYKRTDFEYNFEFKSKFTHQGDCQTLVYEFIEIAQQCFNIKITQNTGREGYFVTGGKKIVHRDNKTGNVDNGRFWYFETHTWAVWNGQPIDVLFGQYGVVSHAKIGEGKPNFKDGTTKYDAGSVIFYLKKSQNKFDRYTTNPKQALIFKP